METEEMLSYYRKFSEITAPKKQSGWLKKFPNGIAEICSVIQGLLIHTYWIERYDADISSDKRLSDMQIRHVCDILTKTPASFAANQLSPTPANQRIVSTCRDFSLLLCSVLQSKGIAARLRCGFATYLNENHFEDHWICEYWNQHHSRWVMVDAQLDQLHQDVLSIEFDPCDVPSDSFLYAGKAWELCRQGKRDPTQFGIHQLHGFPFIKGNIIRDIFALNKLELLPWDSGWGILESYSTSISDAEFRLLDTLAICSATSDEKAAKTHFTSCEEIKLPTDWTWENSPTIDELLSNLPN